MSEYVRITDRKIELTDEGVEALMADYTPTTEDIRNDFARDGKEYALKFDRWLFEMQEDAWDRGYQAGVVDFAAEGTDNPYRQGEEQ